MTMKDRVAALKARLSSLMPSSESLSLIQSQGGRRAVVAVVASYALLIIGLCIYWSIPPKPFDVVQNRDTYLNGSDGSVTGAATTAALLEVTRLLLEKNGGYTSNDIAPPGSMLDNMPNWEYGALIQSRDLARALREVLSRSQSQSQEDVDLTLAEPRINFQNSSWALPATESEYRDARRYLSAYLNRLPSEGEDSAQFYARADNLSYWLSIVEKRLGSLSQRLSASVGQKRINTDLAGDSAARQSTSVTSEVIVKTPWNEIDDVYYESRGAAFALIHFLKAAEVDFADVLEKKNAAVSLRQIIRELEATQQTVWSPVILNGSGFGIWANHSLVLASYLSRANAALIDLRELLAQG